MKTRRSDRQLADDIVAKLNSEEDKAAHPAMEVTSLLQRARDAGGGALRMQYLAQAQQEIAKLDPARHGRLITQLQGEVMALQGRRGDTKVAHVTPGEVVIPERLQTPELLAALRAAARQAGIDPSRLVVGSRRNSVNPKTGQPEFYYNGPDIGGDTTRQPQPTGQQVADLYITHFPQAAHGFGHVGIGVNNPQTKGFFPQVLGKMTPIGAQVPGIVKDDDLSQPHETLRIETDKDQDEAVQNYINKRQANPGWYDLYNRQCTDFVGGALRAGGVPVPADSTPSHYDNMVPNEFFPLLKRGYKPQ